MKNFSWKSSQTQEWNVLRVKSAGCSSRGPGFYWGLPCFYVYNAKFWTPDQVGIQTHACSCTLTGLCCVNLAPSLKRQVSKGPVPGQREMQDPRVMWGVLRRPTGKKEGADGERGEEAAGPGARSEVDPEDRLIGQGQPRWDSHRRWQGPWTGSRWE